MSSIEMGAYPFADASQSLLPITDTEERVETAFGLVKVTIYGNRSKEPIITFHDLGLDADNNFQNFFQFGTAIEFVEQFCVYNINAPGQEMDARALSEKQPFPSMDGLAQIVETIVKHFGIKRFIGFGIGAGANVMLRYAVKHQNTLNALALINADCEQAGWLEWGYQKANINLLRSKGMNNFTVNYLMWHNFGKREDECDPEVIRQYRSFFFNHPNPANLAAYMEAFLNRNDITLQQPADGASTVCNTPILRVPTLLLVGSRSGSLDASVTVNTKLDHSITEWVKVSNSCGLVLDEKSEEVTEALILFLQGQGYLKHLNVRKVVDRLARAASSIDRVTTACAVQHVSEVAADSTA